MEITSYLLGKKSSGGGGGSSEIQTLTQLNEKANELVEYYRSIPSTYEVLTDEPTTLYTPNANYKTYTIQRTSNYGYRVIWWQNGAGIVKNNNDSFNWYLKFDSLDYNLQNFNNKITYLTDTNFYIQQSNEYSSMDDCISAIQNNSTTYEQKRVSSVLIRSTTLYSNTFVVDAQSDTLLSPKKLSSKETIEVIQ